MIQRVFGDLPPVRRSLAGRPAVRAAPCSLPCVGSPRTDERRARWLVLHAKSAVHAVRVRARSTARCGRRPAAAAARSREHHHPPPPPAGIQATWSSTCAPRPAARARTSRRSCAAPVSWSVIDMKRHALRSAPLMPCPPSTPAWGSCALRAAVPCARPQISCDRSRSKVRELKAKLQSRGIDGDGIVVRAVRATGVEGWRAGRRWQASGGRR